MTLSFMNFFDKLTLRLSYSMPEFVNIKGAVGSAGLKISKSAILSLNHHNFSNTKPIYTE